MITSAFLEFPSSPTPWKRYICCFQNYRNFYTLLPSCPMQDGLLLGPGLQDSWLAEMGFEHLTMPCVLFSSFFFLSTSLFPLAKCLFGRDCSTAHLRQHELAAPDLGKRRAATRQMLLQERCCCIPGREQSVRGQMVPSPCSWVYVAV